jgi:hypothetical protein
MLADKKGNMSDHPSCYILEAGVPLCKGKWTMTSWDTLTYGAPDIVIGWEGIVDDEVDVEALGVTVDSGGDNRM